MAIFYKIHTCLELQDLTYSEIVPLSALIACNAMNWPGGTAIYFSHKFHHWLMLYTLSQYIVNVQWSITHMEFLTILQIRDPPCKERCTKKIPEIKPNAEDTGSTGSDLSWVQQLLYSDSAPHHIDISGNILGIGASSSRPHTIWFSGSW